MKIELMSADKLIPYARNPRRNDSAVDAVAASIREFGFRQPIVVDEDMTILVGHTRLKAAKKLGLSDVPVHVAVGLTEAQKKAYRIADNRLNEIAEWDDQMLALELEDIRLDGFDISLTGFDAEALEDIFNEAAGGTEGLTDPDEAPKLNLSDRFMIPPFSVMNAREGWWQDRKRAWLAMGIKSELGRGGGAGTPPHPPTVTQNKDGTLNYGGTKGQSERFDRQRQAAAPGQRATTAKSSAATAQGGR
jgi:hypothetical protein